MTLCKNTLLLIWVLKTKFLLVDNYLKIQSQNFQVVFKMQLDIYDEALLRK